MEEDCNAEGQEELRPVPRALEVLQKQVALCNELVGTLYDRIVPVLMPVEGGKPSQDEARQTCSRVASEIYDNIDRLEMVCDRLKDMIARCEV